MMRNRKERGFVLLAVLAFIAFIMPVILLVLSTISAETMSVGERMKGAKAERAAEQAIGNAQSILYQDRQYPNYWNSLGLQMNAGIASIIVDDGRGSRRNNIVNNGAGPDDIYGTSDDYWIGPRKDRSYLPADDTTDPRNYRYDFRFLNTDGAVYLGQRWAYNLTSNPYIDSVNGSSVPIEFYNPFAAVQSDQDSDGVNEGFVPDELDQILFPGYYPAAIPPVGPYNTDLTSGTIAADMLEYRTKLYQGLYENLDQGPVPSTLTRSYGSVADENGRLNLNIFCKKVRVWAPESSTYDTNAWDNQVTDDFNANNMPGEWGWHWMDNPLFPDRNTTLLRNAAGNVTGVVDFGSVDPATGWPIDSQDGLAWPALGETLQHYTAPDWVYSAVECKRILTALPGVNDAIAENILRTMNPDITTIPDPPSEDGGTPTADNHRLDAPNLTPTLAALNVTTSGGGQITGFEWRYDWYDDDDLPLSPPKPFNDVKELLNVQGITNAKFDRLKDLVTVYSYDTNVVQNYISDVSSTVDPVNPPNMPLGSTRRQMPGNMLDTDALPDLRYDLNKQLEDTSMTALEQEADVLYAFLYNHLPEGVFNKFTLPVVDREHRGPSDHLGPAPVGGGTDGNPYNVGEYGHQYDIDLGGGATEPGADYPALDPPFSRDSALSILLYRYGLTQEDALRYSQAGGNSRIVQPGIPVQGTRSFIPIVDPIILIPGLFEIYFQPAYLPMQSRGENVNAVIPPHQFDSVADVLEVPLYKFSRFSVGIMADPPSDYVCSTTGKDEVTVNYYVSMSDIIQLGEYDDSGTVGDITDDQIAYPYDIYFDYNNDNNPDDMVTLTFGDNLRLVSAPPTSDAPGILTTFSQPTGQRYLQFQHTFDIGEIPEPDETLAGTNDGDFAFDAFGNPFITARVMAVKASGTPEATQSDAVVKVYLQENCDAFVPIKASILAVRVSADQFMLLSSVGGGQEEPNSFRLYNWAFNGSPQEVDGTWPAQPLGRDPRTVFVSPLNDTISLTVYDLYSPMAGPCWPGLPVPVGVTTLPPGIINANEVQPAFPAAPYPNVGRDTDTVQVEIIGSTPNVAAEIACDPPVVEQGGSVLLHIGAYGGVSPYNLNVQIFDSGGGLVQSYNYGGYQNNTLTVETDPFPTQGTYRVVLTAVDSTTPIPTSAVDITSLVVGNTGSKGKSFTNVPNMTASIDLEPLASPSKGFTATASVSGGRGAYGYFWQVFDEFGALAQGDQGQDLTSNDQSFTVQFAANQSQDGVYFVKVMVIDQTNINPNNSSNTVLATDTEMVVIGSPGLSSYQPMATLVAIPPGNGAESVAENSQIPLITGSGPQPILSTDLGVPPIVPSVAGAGSTIQIYGYNFDPHPQHNFVTFGGGATTSPTNPPILDPSYAGPAPARQIMTVVVPAEARTGWLTVKTLDGGNGGVSGRAFFQTHFLISFDAIGSIIPDIMHNLRMEVDFQGDGIIDARADTSRMSGSPGIVSYQQMPSLQHDYANDGFGNYNATLVVTDLDNNKVAVSHQIIQIRDLTPLINNPNNSANAYGLNVSLQPMYADRYPLPGMGLDIRSYVGGITSTFGLKYKWNVDGNSRYALLTRTPPPTPTFWETEANNTSATADIMPIDYDPLTDNATWTGRTASTADVDWFRLDFPQAGTMSMLLECFAVNGTEQLTIELYDNALALIDSNQILAGDTTAIATTGRNAPAGFYYIRVSGNSAQTYELESTYSPNPGNTFWESEPNDIDTDADVMPIDYDPDRDAFPFTGVVRGNTDPEDWYVITTPSTGTLNVFVQSPDPGPADELYITLYNNVLIPIDNATLDNTTVAGVVGTGVDIPAGTFYVYITPNNNPQNRYQIDPSFVPQGSWVGAGPVNFSVSSNISADGRFVSPDVPVKYYANLGFNFTTTDPNVFNIQIDNRDTNGDGMPDSPLTFRWDFTGEGVTDYVQNIPTSQILTDLYSSAVSGSAGWNYLATGNYSKGTLLVAGNLLITYYDNSTSVQPFTLPAPAPLPGVDVSNVLSTLSLPTLGNDTGHLIALTVFGEDFDLTSGVSNAILATDTIYIPSGLHPMDNVAAFLATENPYVLSNTPGNTIYTLTGINGQGGDMQYWADLNTDGLFEIGGQGFFNPQTHTRVTATNGLNLLNAGAINSYPTSLPGVWFQFIDIGINIESDRGIYCGAGLVRDNPPAGEAVSYSFDSQAVFVGGNRGAGSASPLSLGADIFIDPLAGVTTQGFSLESFVAGGSSPYNYRWDIIHMDTGTPIFMSDLNQHYAPNPSFVPSTDANDELAGNVAGTYQIVLTVFDASGAFIVSRPRLLTVEEAPLNAQLMAMPPAVAVNEPVRFLVYVDGGAPPYNITIDYDDPDASGMTANVVTTGRYTPFEHTYTSVWMEGSSPANGRYDDPEDGRNPTISVIDANGDVINTVTSPFNATQKVLIGERLPLNITSLVSPSSGWNNFRVAVNYAIAGGRKFGGSSLGNLVTSGAAGNISGLFGQTSDYFVTIALVTSEGDLVDMQFRDTRTTIINPYGTDGVLMNGDVGEVYDPVYVTVPYAGNYFVIVTATDGSGEFAISQQQVYAAGYLTPQTYGDTTPKVRRDRDGRPLHAARVWVDPLYEGSPSGDWRDNDVRLREADVQVFGDLLTVDPNPSFMSPGFMAAKDPAAVPMFDMNYLTDPQTNTPVDFYDTYTMGRININTASEEVLAALFSKIIKRRAYFVTDGTDYSRGDRDYENDEYVTRSEANALARAVVEYRNAYYDAYKPVTSNTPGGYEYTHGANADPYASGDIRVDHVPVIGPWDGVNPRTDDYPDPGARDGLWPDQGDNDNRNTWDNFRGVYYNLARSGALDLQFYATSDIAVVREKLTGESDESYAKYLNDTLDNTRTLDGLDPMGVDERRGYDARQYFTYNTEAGETRADARNDIALLYDGGEIAYTYIQNPPFQSLFDLFKVIGVLNQDMYDDLMEEDIRTFNVEDTNGDGNRDNVEIDANDFSTQMRTLSGPSLFRYVERWDALNNEYKVIANYLDDIAPYITTRSYTFRVTGIGGVSLSGGASAAPVAADQVSRDRVIEQVLDLGKMHTQRRDPTAVNSSTSGRKAFEVLYSDNFAGGSS